MLDFVLKMTTEERSKFLIQKIIKEEQEQDWLVAKNMHNFVIDERESCNKLMQEARGDYSKVHETECLCKRLFYTSRPDNVAKEFKEMVGNTTDGFQVTSFEFDNGPYESTDRGLQVKFIPESFGFNNNVTSFNKILD